MNKTTKIQRIGGELNSFMDNNYNLDPFVIAKKVKEIAEKYGLEDKEIVDSDGLAGFVRRQYFLIGDLIYMVVDYDTTDAEVREYESDATISAEIYGITNKKAFIESLDTDTKAGRILYGMLTGKDISENFN